jgi:hypothetical protein
MGLRTYVYDCQVAFFSITRIMPGTRLAFFLRIMKGE